MPLNYFLLNGDNADSYQVVTQAEYDAARPWNGTLHLGVARMLEQTMQTQWRLHGPLNDTLLVTTSFQGQTRPCHAEPVYQIGVSGGGRVSDDDTPFALYPRISHHETKLTRAEAIARHHEVVAYCSAIDATPAAPGETDREWLERLYDTMEAWLQETQTLPMHCDCVGRQRTCEARHQQRSTRQVHTHSNG